MTKVPIWVRLSRALAFGRHIPPAKLLRRLQLSLQRRWQDNTGWRLSQADAAPIMTDHPPLPLVPPRSDMVTAAGRRFAFTCLARTHQMANAIDWEAPGPGPQLQLWRMNLHYMEYLEEVEAADFTALVQAWCAASQPMRKGMWRDSWNAYALSLRVVVWMQQIARHRARLPEAVLAALLASLAGQLRFLAHNLETDIGGNHLVKNIKALLWASAFFHGEEAENWRRLGLKWLDVALREQILPDGMHYERSPSYHAQVFADLLECQHALPQAERPPALASALRGMAQAIADLAHPDGLVAQFNDSGLDMAYPPDECLQAFETLFHSRPQPRPVFAYPSAGYFGLRSGENYFVADCGRMAPDDLPAHGHGDILSFEWSVAGQRVVVDQGVFEYIPGARRAQSRAAASHNTLCFAGADQADFFGAFRVGRRPDVFVTRQESGDGQMVLEGWHNGFAHLPGTPRHRRRFEVLPGQITIIDQIEGEPKTDARINFLFHPDVVAKLTGADPADAGADRVNYPLDAGKGDPFRPEISTFPAGQASLHITRSAPASTVSASASSYLRITLHSSAPVSLEQAVWWPNMGTELKTLRASIVVACHVREVITVLRVEKPASGATQEVL